MYEVLNQYTVRNSANNEILHQAISTSHLVDSERSLLLLNYHNNVSFIYFLMIYLFIYSLAFSWIVVFILECLDWNHFLSLMKLTLQKLTFFLSASK